MLTKVNLEFKLNKTGSDHNLRSLEEYLDELDINTAGNVDLRSMMDNLIQELGERNDINNDDNHIVTVFDDLVQYTDRATEILANQVAKQDGGKLLEKIRIGYNVLFL